MNKTTFLSSMDSLFLLVPQWLIQKRWYKITCKKKDTYIWADLVVVMDSGRLTCMVVHG